MTFSDAHAVTPVAGSTPSPITIRPQTADDKLFVAALLARAFGPGRFARAAFRVREHIPVDETLSLVAEIGGQPAGAVAMTAIGIGETGGYLLGPLAIDPVFRNKGAGRTLVREVSALALGRERGKFVLLIGDAPYYAAAGFAPVREGVIVFPGPVDPARVLVNWGQNRPAILNGAIGPAEFDQAMT